MNDPQLSDTEALHQLGLKVTIEHGGLLVVTFVKNGARDLWIPVDGPRELYANLEVWTYEGQLYVPTPEGATA